MIDANRFSSRTPPPHWRSCRQPASGSPRCRCLRRCILDAPTPAQLQRFDEARYLHQVVIQTAEGTLLRFDDLPEALASHPAQAGERWRCHFHLPIFLGALDDGMCTTQPFIKALLPLLPAELLLEVETYT